MSLNIKTNISDPANYKSGRTSTPKYIVIHYTANDGDTDEGNGSFFHRSKRYASANYFVDEDSATLSVKETDTAQHCADKQKYLNGGGQYKGKCKNANSLAIEMCSDKVNGDYIITEKTIANTIELTKILMKKYNISVDNVLRHYDVTGKMCPEPFVKHSEQWKNFKERLTSIKYPEYKAENIKIIVNGKVETLSSIKKDGFNYIKLRDVARVIPNSFVLVYDKNTKSITINGKIFKPTASVAFGGYIYVQLRELSQTVGTFEVSYDVTKNMPTIKTH